MTHLRVLAVAAGRGLGRRRRAPRHGVVLLAVLALVAGACAGPPPPIAEQDYRLVFSDEFNAASVNPFVWATAPFGNSLGPTVADGVMTIRSNAANDYYWGYLASTGPRSAVEPSYANETAFQEGYFEARIRFTDNRWIWPAFWLFSMAKSEAWPGEDCSRLNAEIDIMENGIQGGDGSHPASSWYYGNLHRNTTDHTWDGYCGQGDQVRPLSARAWPGVNLSQWHVWAARWTRSEICTYLDGARIGCVTPFDSTPQPMHLTFSVQYLGVCNGCGARPSELRMSVDWVRVWQRG
jgi:beta-glucanase (GH16 family)